MSQVICCKCIDNVGSFYTPISGSDCNNLSLTPDGLAGWTSVAGGEPCNCGGEPLEPVETPEPEAEVADDGETIGFTESNKRWNSFYSYRPEFMCGIGTRIVTFKQGDVYEHNSSTTIPEYNEFYGVTYASEMHVISNEAPSNNKVYKAFSQESDDVWDVDFESPNGQTSNLIASDFDTRENIHYSDMMNDTSSPGGLIEGDRMRDATLLAKCKILTNKFTRMFGVNFNIVPSFRSNK
mgnify:CR=1 FL=1|tara:strand:- start:6399 stop:7112 length:714 start_codon:yes stop_codon:yes gene_type:complete